MPITVQCGAVQAKLFVIIGVVLSTPGASEAVLKPCLEILKCR
jgi:hypothetical protein